MDTFLEFIREIVKGLVRELIAYLFRRSVLKTEKTTLRRCKHKGGFRKK